MSLQRTCSRARLLPVLAVFTAPLVVGCPSDLRERNLQLIEEAAGRSPQYGGDLDIGTVYVTLSALSWDPADWTWKINHDTGSYFEHLFVGDLDQSITQGGTQVFQTETYLLPEAVKGELAERWHWEDDLTLVIELRRGVMFPGKPGVMQRRELDAHDVVYSYEVLEASPKRQTTFLEHIESVTARDDFTVVIELAHFHSEWQYRFGYGYYTPIQPRELAEVETKDWRNATGSGPFQLTNYIPGNKQTYTRTPEYWGRAKIDGVEYQLPFLDSFTYRVIKDQATYLTALRTAEIDLLEVITWINVEPLQKSTPELRWSRRLLSQGTIFAMRNDVAPFDDVRVRRAMNLAVNQREILELYHDGNAELFAFPMHPAFGAYFEALEEMPASIQELYTYQPEKAKALLAEAGYPEGFVTTAQACACNEPLLNQLQVIVDQLSRIGVTVEIEPLEYSAFLSAMTTKTHAPIYVNMSGHVSPTSSLRKFRTGETWNPSMFNDPEWDAQVLAAVKTRDEDERIAMVHELTRQLLEQAPHVWLPTPYVYSAWWPWVKNYSGELRAGAVRPGPIYARIWIDQQLKRDMGFE